MAEFFLSYKSDDRQRAALIAKALVDEGLDVWWDPALAAGEDYQEVIDRNLREALVVIVLWSKNSVKSRWVRSEATVGDQFGALAPARIDGCDLPTAFVLVQTADLSEWNGEQADPKWREFVGDLRAKRDRRRTLATATTAPPPPDSNVIESIFWQSIADSSEAADFESYLSRYPNGHFIDLANRRRERLRSPAAAREGATVEKQKRRLAPVFAFLAVAALIAGGAGAYFWMKVKGGASLTAAALNIDRRRNPEIIDEQMRPAIYKARDDAKLAEEAALRAQEAGRKGEEAAAAARNKAPGTIAFTHDGILDQGEGTRATGLQGYGVRTYVGSTGIGVRFAGAFENGRANGSVLRVFSDGQRYAGDVVADENSGYAVFTSKDGQIVSRGLVKSQKLASGTISFSDGHVLEGAFQDGFGVSWRASGHLDAAGRYLNGEMTETLQIGSIEDDFQSANEALKLNPNDSNALNLRCYALARANRELLKALDDCDTSLGLSPKDANTMDSRALVLFRLGRFDEAVTAWNGAVAASPKFAPFRYGRGLAELRAGREAAGHADIAAALAMDAKAGVEYDKMGIKP